MVGNGIWLPRSWRLRGRFRLDRLFRTHGLNSRAMITIQAPTWQLPSYNLINPVRQKPDLHAGSCRPKQKAAPGANAGAASGDLVKLNRGSALSSQIRPSSFPTARWHFSSSEGCKRPQIPYVEILPCRKGDRKRNPIMVAAQPCRAKLDYRPKLAKTDITAEVSALNTPHQCVQGFDSSFERWTPSEYKKPRRQR